MPNPAPQSPQALQLLTQRLPHAEGLPLPAHQTAGAAGFDLPAAIDADITLAHGERALVPTGFCFAIPEGYCGQIWPRSGLAVKQGIDTLAGMIDCDYRGELKIALINHGAEPFVITRGMRIAQMVVVPYARVETVPAETLPDTVRGAGGYGSTGLKSAAG